MSGDEADAGPVRRAPPMRLEEVFYKPDFKGTYDRQRDGIAFKFPTELLVAMHQFKEARQ